MSRELAEQKEKKYGLIREVSSSSNGEKNLERMSAEIKKKYMENLKEDTRQVKAKFVNSEPKGADHCMIYKKYACEPVQTWNFKHNETYVVPFGLVKHVNQNCKKMLNTLDPRDGQTQIRIPEQLQEFIPITFS